MFDRQTVAHVAVLVWVTTYNIKGSVACLSNGSTSCLLIIAYLMWSPIFNELFGIHRTLRGIHKKLGAIDEP